ncbi:F0F1 ATP synthase subunit delta [Pseudolactococcus chungangensis]|jgi:ATP synthase, F1 delta subunit|uniref:ATP synthase subunit delta n=1 Tax=Pseudolactococcus chungangensis CAU 28 = DSM 22330 TaxID=1122154 RepID=A0A1K2HCF0_9LACT|nr:F0F1 ATP synthase subunit delta [Lactococcus chungangensis]MDD3016567.1 F0F1 ATP synthase subunit delta [Lactococcus chungangensis]NCB81702.1 F0F1 ATP synthase subunit delta [Bacilli bacterium]PCS04146.1 F0F1 ATP synthase subunit delta [Lactococcus chungangensis CAU 28 = DSM 22330]SFZ74423.1 F-type H+-transporting ATPase subunit delta [Lactococcus chungangensis CAU 28 = DSM 22330]
MSLIIAQKYSKALLEVAQERQQLEAVLAEVAAFNQVIQSTDLQDFLVDVAYSDDKKHQVIESLQNVSSDIFKNFLEVLVKNQRMALLPLIIKEVRHQADNLFKISDVDVTSAIVLSDIQLSKLETTIKSKFDLNEVTIKNTVDTSILGGVIINARGKSIDASIKSQLNKIAKSII